MPNPYAMPDGQYVLANSYAEAAEKHRAMTAPKPTVKPPMEIEMAMEAVDAFPRADVAQLKQPSQWTQAKEGFFADTIDESLAYYQKLRPDWDVRVIKPRGVPVIAMQNPATYEVEFANIPGMDVGDVSRGAGAVAPVVGATTAAALSGGSTLGIGAVAGLAELLREGAQGLGGTQRESLGEYGTRAGISALAELPAGLLASGATGLTNSAMKRGSGARTTAEMVKSMKRAEDLGFGPVPLKGFQFTQDPAYQRFVGQKMQLSPEGKAYASNLATDVKEAGEALAPGYTTPPSETLHNIAKQKYQNARDLSAPPNASVAGGGYMELTDTVRGQRKEAMKDAYSKVDEALRVEAPEFDLSPVIAASKERVRLGEGLSREAMEELPGETTVDTIQTAVNVAEQPSQKLRTLENMIARLDPEQTDYKVLKELRTQVGKLRESTTIGKALGGVDQAKVSEVFGELSDALMRPVNADDVPGYTGAIADATGKARRYYGTYDVGQVKNILNAKDAGQKNHLWGQVANDPAHLEDDFLNVIEEAPATMQTQTRGNLLRHIMSSADPLETLEKWRASSGNGFEWLTRDVAVSDTIDQAVRLRRELNNSSFRDAWQDATMKTDFAKEMLRKEATTPTATANMVNTLGGRGSEAHEALRTAAIEDLVHSSLRNNSTLGHSALDPIQLKEGIKKLKKTGQWDLLTDADRGKLEGLPGYASVAWETGDAGNGLVTAGLLGKLFTVQGAPEAAGKLMSSRWVARLLLSEKLNRNALTKAAAKAERTSGKQAFSGRWPRAAATVINNVATEGLAREKQAAEELRAAKRGATR